MTNVFDYSPVSESGALDLGRHRPESMGLLVLVIAACAVLGLVILLSNGSLMATTGFVAVSVIVVLTFYRLDFGFYMLMLCSIFFGQFEVPGFDTLTYRVSYFKNLKEIPYLPYFSMGDANVFELHFLFIIVV